MYRKITAMVAAMVLAMVALVVTSSPAQAVTCYEKKLPRVQFEYNKPMSDNDTLLLADLFYDQCRGPSRWWVRAEMFVMTWDVQGKKCTNEFDYIIWELYAYDSFGHQMRKTFKQYCDGTSADTRAVSYAPKNVPNLFYAENGSWPDLAPKWRITAEIVRSGPVINSSFMKKGAFPL